jgi:ABC-type lipoprotein export system ATPase subunit
VSARAGSAVLCDGLVKIYRVAEREVVALQGLELEVSAGEMLGIVGPSGSGKSTLLNVVGGLDRPSAGRLLVDGVALAGLPDAALDHYRRERVGFVWQLPGRNLVPHLSAQENVALPMVLAMMPAPARRERAAELLVAVGLEARAAHLPAHLSGGEQQRLAIAVALANRPRLLLADEPTGELDSATAGEIYALFRALNERYGLTVVIVSHDPAVARVVDRVVTIRDGRTSTETRQVGRPVPRAGEEEATEEEVGMEELVVMDSTGRLQVPEEMREEYGLAGRVRLERTPDGVLIRPQDAEEWDGG